VGRRGLRRQSVFCPRQSVFCPAARRADVGEGRTVDRRDGGQKTLCLGQKTLCLIIRETPDIRRAWDALTLEYGEI
jgi:hypothetical protein